jgi:Rrf2 family protein
MGIVRLSEATSIALHGMAALAKIDGESINVKTLAKKIGASEHHLHKVMRKLVEAGLVVSDRGPKGGFLLAKDPAEISLLDIYQSMEGKLKEERCGLERTFCPFGKTCMFCDLFKELTGTFKEHFEKKTLASYV